jgi:hypothetical protein
MDENATGSVACLEFIKHPISGSSGNGKTPRNAGWMVQQFAVSQGLSKIY